MIGFVVLGVVLVIAGAVLNTWIDRRRFYRRNAAGIEEFSSYGSAMAARGLEGLAQVGARLGIGGGVVLLGMTFLQFMFLRH